MTRFLCDPGARTGFKLRSQMDRPSARRAFFVDEPGMLHQQKIFSTGRLIVILKSLVYSLALLLLMSHSSAAQSPDASLTKTNEERENRQELEQKALALLEDVVSQAQMLKRPENRIHIQAVAANLFWTRDEKRARALFKEAMKGLAELMSGIDNTDPQYHNLIQAPAQLRHEILQMIAPRDPQLALEFLRATRQPAPPPTAPGSRPPDNNLQLELSLASQIAENDPKLALQIAEEGLAQGFSYGLPDLIRQLMSKDRDGAFKLTGALVRKLRAENLLKDQEVANNVVSLLGVLRDVSAPNTPPDTARNITPTVDLQAYQEVLEMTLTAALRSSLRESTYNVERNIAHSYLTTLEPLLPDVERYAPLRVAALRRKIADYKKTADPHTRFWNEHQDLINNGTAEALLEAAASAPVEFRITLYQQALAKVISEGDLSRARRIIEDNISDAYERKQMLDNLEQQTFWHAASAGKLNEARQTLARLRSDEERVGMLIQLAMMAAAKGDGRSALQILGEARTMVGNRAGNYPQLQSQLQVAHAYATLEPSQSFEILEALAGQLNELLAAAEVLNGFEQQYFKEGELMPQGSTLGNMVSQHIDELSRLALIDFDHSKSVAGRFQRHETRIMAGLSIAQGVLSGNSENKSAHRRVMGPMSFFYRGNKRVPVIRF